MGGAHPAGRSAREYLDPHVMHRDIGSLRLSFVPGVQRFSEKVQNTRGVGTGRDCARHVYSKFEYRHCLTSKLKRTFLFFSEEANDNGITGMSS